MTITMEPLKNEIRRLIMGALRKAFAQSSIARDARNKALSDEVGIRKGKRYVCEFCDGNFPQTDINVDHIEPVIPVEKSSSEMSWDEIIENMFCGQSNLRVLCKECHKSHSKLQNKDRKSIKEAIIVYNEEAE